MTLRTALMDSKVAYLVHFAIDNTYSYAERENFKAENTMIEVGKTYSISLNDNKYDGLVLEKGMHNSNTSICIFKT